MSVNRPLLVGLTGGIGSGKSIVAKFFNVLGIPVYYADDRAKWLMSNDPELKNNIITTFGADSFTADGQLNRTYLAEKVFGDPEATKKINSLVHPAVKTDFENWAKHQNTPYVIKEAALLFETGSYKELDKIINVSSPLKLRVSRILLRDQRSEAQINEIINRQLPDEEKNKLADFVIKNSENKMVIPQVLEIHQKLLG
ncbi:dephospho-CoA kinase [Litoribacter ruber]|uniref:Dephospho-CoA kinase n=1 Tax=Litoribacter ruber TaxID=702568 RepID=A0AAP2CH30_9BACT|nr:MULTISPECIES: dephospho-CoA kinase [Litoribacter]MBS9522495.1 dephospho-CoA kinase [Litoribacter alkaliphilus]MBT0811015.1 dephospho-CoA kinase [Litoribacter ruber]